MVGKVLALTGNGISRCEKGTDPLVGGEELSDAEPQRLAVDKERTAIRS